MKCNECYYHETIAKKTKVKTSTVHKTATELLTYCHRVKRYVDDMVSYDLDKEVLEVQCKAFKKLHTGDGYGTLPIQEGTIC